MQNVLKRKYDNGKLFKFARTSMEVEHFFITNTFSIDKIERSIHQNITVKTWIYISHHTSFIKHVNELQHCLFVA